MKTASRQYKSQMTKLLRNHSYVGISFGNIDVSAGSDGAWGGEQLPWSKTNTLDYRHVYEDNVATLELNRWRLNGSQNILSGNTVNDGYIADAMSDGSGDIDYTMERLFGYTHALSGITITFDDENDEYPLQVDVAFTDAEGSETVSASPTAPTTEVTYASESVIGIAFHFTKMLPYRRPRVHTTIWGVGYSYSNADIVSCSQSVDVDPLSRRLPQEKFSFTILDYEHKFDPDNPTGVYSTINRGAPIKVSYGYELDDGRIEWLDSDTYSLDNKPSFASNKVTFNGTGLLATMTNNYYRGTLGNKSFYDMAVDVLTDANLTPTETGDNPWDVDESLKNMYCSAPMPIQSHAVCLQMIAHACNCRLYTDDNNIIHLKPFGVTPAGVFKGTFEDDGHAWISSWDAVDYGTESVSCYATLELNRWVFGTDQVIANPNDLSPSGYASSAMSNANGNIDASWTKTFDVLHDIPRIVITFDDVMEEYPDTLVVTYYGRDGTVIGTKTVHPDDVTYAIESEYEDCEKFTVHTTAMKLPYRRERVSRTAYFETDYALTLDSIKQDTLVTTKLDRLRNVIVNEYSLSQPNDNTTKLFETFAPEAEMHIEYQLASNVIITIDDGNDSLVGTARTDMSVVGSSGNQYKAYARAADLHLPNGANHIIVEGIPLNEGCTTHTYSYGLSGEDDIEENVLITNKDIADAHADHVGTYLQLRNTYDSAYRGSPEVESGDIISLQTTYDNVVYGIILVDKLDFNGALSGNLKVKGIV